MPHFFLPELSLINCKKSMQHYAYEYALLTKHEVMMTGYWPSSLFALQDGPRLRLGP